MLITLIIIHCIFNLCSMYLHLIRFLLVLLNLNYFFSLGGWGGGEGNTRKYVTYCLLGGIFFFLNIKLVLSHHPLWTPLHAL